MHNCVWDRWPQFVRGRLHVLYEVTGEVHYVQRQPLGCTGRDGGRDYSGSSFSCDAVGVTKSVRT
jgi:hypothetical protein